MAVIAVTLWVIDHCFVAFSYLKDLFMCHVSPREWLNGIHAILEQQRIRRTVEPSQSDRTGGERVDETQRELEGKGSSFVIKIEQEFGTKSSLLNHYPSSGWKAAVTRSTWPEEFYSLHPISSHFAERNPSASSFYSGWDGEKQKIVAQSINITWGSEKSVGWGF